MHFLRPQDLHQGIQKGSALLHWNKKHGFVCRDIVFGCCRKVRLKARKTRLFNGATTESLLRSFVVFLFVFLFDIFFDIWGGCVFEQHLFSDLCMSFWSTLAALCIKCNANSSFLCSQIQRQWHKNNSHCLSVVDALDECWWICIEQWTTMQLVFIKMIGNVLFTY